MKLRHFSFAGVLALAACPGPAAKPTPTPSTGKPLPEVVELTDPSKIDPKDGTVLVKLAIDADLKAYLVYQMDKETCTPQRAYKVDATLIPTLDKAGQFVGGPRPSPPPPPDGEDLGKHLAEQCRALVPK